MKNYVSSCCYATMVNFEWCDCCDHACKAELPFPIHRVSIGNLAEKSLIVRRSKNGNNYTKFNVPAFMLAPNGSKIENPEYQFLILEKEGV